MMQNKSTSALSALTSDIGGDRISVVIPAFNAGAHLDATLRSVFAQTMLPGEVIVVDDGSSDNTVAVARSFGVTVISLTNRGPSAARNAGTQAATREYIAYLDADDLWPPEKLSRQFGALQKHAEPAFSFTDYRCFDEFGVRLCKSELRRQPAFRKAVGNLRGRTAALIAGNDRRPVLMDSYILPSSVLVRRSDVLAVGGYDESLRVCEDYELFLRLLKIIPAVVIVEPLLYYRRHASQATASPVAMVAGLFEVAQRVFAAVDRYPTADAQYIATKGFLLHYRMGLWHARLGHFDEAIPSLQLSLAARRTIRAGILLSASRLAQSGLGRRTFAIVRSLWKSRPKRRSISAPN